MYGLASSTGRTLLKGCREKFAERVDCGGFSAGWKSSGAQIPPLVPVGKLPASKLAISTRTVPTFLEIAHSVGSKPNPRGRDRSGCCLCSRWKPPSNRGVEILFV